MTNPQELIKLIIETEDPNGFYRDELVGQLSKLNPNDLIPLIRSQKAVAAKAGVWMATELGARGHELLYEISPMLSHSIPYIRFYALDCVLLWAGAKDGEILCDASKLLVDSDEMVSQQCICFIAACSVLQLRAMRDELTGVMFEMVSWLISCKSREFKEVQNKLDSINIWWKIGLAAALRFASSDSDALEAARSSKNLELKKIADEEFEVGRWI